MARIMHNRNMHEQQRQTVGTSNAYGYNAVQSATVDGYLKIAK